MKVGNLDTWKEIALTGTSGDMVDDILEDWEADRLTLIDRIKKAEEEIEYLQLEVLNNSYRD